MSKINKNKPENIYNTLESIYMMDEEKTEYGKVMLESISDKINKNDISMLLKDIYRENLNFNTFGNIHTYNDFFKNEQSKIYIYNTYMKIKTNVNNPIFFEDIKNIKNLFVCDFINLDYFWLKSVTSLLV